MSVDAILSNLLQPAILFFLLGILAAIFRSDLELPQPVPKLLSLYLLLAIGFRGGVELVHNPLSSTDIFMLLTAVAMSILVPLIAFFILRTRFGTADAAAMAATYGSISAVTFVTATAFLDRLAVGYGGHMVASMALMESPAIIVGVMLYRRFSPSGDTPFEIRELLREAFLNGAVFVLLGSLVIGMLSGDRGAATMSPFTELVFPGVLALFLLDLGLVAGRRFGDLRRCGTFVVAFGLLFPPINAAVAIFIARVLGASHGDALLLAVLCASASYIAVPAAVRMAIPEASPGLYVTASLAVTFPFNIALGIPLYDVAIRSIWS